MKTERACNFSLSVLHCAPLHEIFFFTSDLWACLNLCLSLWFFQQFRVPQPPHPLCKVSPIQPSQHWRRDTHMPDTHRLPWVNTHARTHTNTHSKFDINNMDMFTSAVLHFCCYYMFLACKWKTAFDTFTLQQSTLQNPAVPSVVCICAGLSGPKHRSHQMTTKISNHFISFKDCCAGTQCTHPSCLGFFS